MRPTYETGADLQREKALAQHLKNKFGWRLKKMKSQYQIDFVKLAETSNDVTAFVEVKTRTYTWQRIDELGGYLLSYDKYLRGLDLAQTSKHPFVLVVADGESVVRAAVLSAIEPGALRVVLGGREDRGDEADIEPCVLIPVNAFKVIS